MSDRFRRTLDLNFLRRHSNSNDSSFQQFFDFLLFRVAVLVRMTLYLLAFIRGHFCWFKSSIAYVFQLCPFFPPPWKSSRFFFFFYFSSSSSFIFPLFRLFPGTDGLLSATAIHSIFSSSYPSAPSYSQEVFGLIAALFPLIFLIHIPFFHPIVLKQFQFLF